MKYIIGGLAIIFCLYALGYFLKRKHFKEVDRLESWKIELMNRPVLEELSKVKKLNMDGEAEKLFEKWRNNWDEIIAVQLPNIEEYLFDAEENIEKYRFKKAKGIMHSIETELNQIEDQIKALIEEINDLVGSEEKNRIKIEELKEAYRECRKKFLAHNHQYGKGANQLQKCLDDIGEKFQSFEELTSNGNYLEARKTVLHIEQALQELTYKMEVIPNYLIECRSQIPSQINELKSGYQEMLKQGYVLEHIKLDVEIENIENQLNTFLQLIEKLDIKEVEKGIEETKQNIELLYDLLEKEVKAKHFIEKHNDETKMMLETIVEANDQLKDEVEIIKQSYFISDSQLHDIHQLEKKLTQLLKKFELYELKIKSNETAHSLLMEELEDVRKELQTTKEEIDSLSEQLQALRKDELEAREKVKHLSRILSKAIKSVSKSNIPGLSDEYIQLIDDASGSIEKVKETFEEKPLDIPKIKENLDIAVKLVENTVEKINDLIETVMLAERVIQYGNRYRSSNSYVNEQLNEAEQMFRSYQYQASLEQAATAIEKVEPGALKKIEQWLSEELLEENK